MKKLAVLAVAAMLVFSVAGQAAAFFEDFKLVRIMYDTTETVEWGSDLGVTMSLATGPSTWGNVGDLLNTSDFDGGFGNVKVGYFAANNNKALQADYWIAGGYNDGDGLTILGGKATTLQAITNSVLGYYSSPAVSTASKSTGLGTNSYFRKMETPVGSFGNTLQSPNPGYEATQILTALGGTDHYFDMMLYAFDYNNATSNPGVDVAIVRTYMTAGADNDFATLADNKIGTTLINPVPIPGSVLLLASGLLGLFGFRRKRA